MGSNSDYMGNHTEVHMASRGKRRPTAAIIAALTDRISTFDELLEAVLG